MSCDCSGFQMQSHDFPYHNVTIHIFPTKIKMLANYVSRPIIQWFHQFFYSKKRCSQKLQHHRNTGVRPKNGSHTCFLIGLRTTQLKNVVPAAVGIYRSHTNIYAALSRVDTKLVFLLKTHLFSFRQDFFCKTSRTSLRSHLHPLD